MQRQSNEFQRLVAEVCTGQVGASFALRLPVFRTHCCFRRDGDRPLEAA